jgi:hypothetical protein
VLAKEFFCWNPEIKRIMGRTYCAWWTYSKLQKWFVFIYKWPEF